MPTNYNGSPTATQSPASPPADGVAPEIVLPADGDADNAASVAQAFKVGADYIAFLQDRFGNSSVFTQQFIERYRNARLQSRFLVDRLGFPLGKIGHWYDDFSQYYGVVKSAVGNGVFGGRWNYSISGDAAGGGISAFGPASDDPASGSPDGDLRSPGIFVSTTNSGSAASYDSIETAFPQTILDEDTSISMQWDGKLGIGSSGVQEDFIGVVTNSFQGTTGTTGANAPYGFGFYFWQGNSQPTHWYLYYRQAGAGGATIVDTGVVVSGRQRFKLEYQGQNNDDASLAHVSFWINGTLITGAPIAADMTGAGGASFATARPLVRHVDHDNEVTWAAAMAVQFGTNLWAGNVPL